MNIFRRRVGDRRQSLWKRKGDSVAAAPALKRLRDKLSITRRRSSMRTANSETTVNSTSTSETISPPPSTASSLSPLSLLVSKFITENACKTHDSFQDEKQRNDFVFDLKNTFQSLRSGKQSPPRRSVSSVATLIDFFAETTKGTLSSMQNEEERIDFEEHLARELWQNFEVDASMETRTL